MNAKWLVGMMLLWFSVTIVSLILDAQYVGADDVAKLNTLLHPSFLAGADIPFIGFFVVVFNYISVFISTLTFDYSFLTGGFEVLKYVGICLSVGTIVMLVLALRGSG